MGDLEAKTISKQEDKDDHSKMYTPIATQGG